MCASKPWRDLVRREGLSIIHDPIECQLEYSEPKIDTRSHRTNWSSLIILHGLNGCPYRTFYDQSTNFYWPGHLPKSLPTARIMVFGYIADIHTGGSNDLGVYQHAESLLLHLKNNRIGSQQEKRPIAFLGHSLGGLVIKQALVNSSHRAPGDTTLHSTKLIVFLGTPHRGSHVLDKSLTKIVLSVMKLGSNELPKNLKSMLQPRANESFMVNTDFMRVKGKIPIVNFYEQRSKYPLQELVVDKESAVFDSEYSENIPVARDHQQLVRFEGANDDAYHTLCQTLQRNVTNLLHDIAKMADDGYSQRMMRSCLRSLGESNIRTGSTPSREAHHKTLGWLWDADSELLRWLEAGSGLFSITGKPGSGKSLLMNEVAKRIRKAYRDRFSVVVQHAFNARGEPEEHSLEGFLRSAIVQVLRQHPASFDAMLEEWLFVSGDTGRAEGRLQNPQDMESAAWPLSSLKASLLAIATYASQQSRVCFIIDALEECNGDVRGNGEMLRFLESLSTVYRSSLARHGICICLSSRDLPSIPPSAIAGMFRMEERNGPDIDAYINDRWSELSSLVGPSDEIKQLKYDLLRKADGIFLWANLALERMQTALEDGATIAELREAIEDTPDELGGIFRLLLRNINPTYRKETNMMLAIAIAAHRPLSLIEFRYAMAVHSIPSVSSHKDLTASANTVQGDSAMKKRIRSRCGGLLEVKGVNNERADDVDIASHSRTEVVQFMHQSVKEYLVSKQGEDDGRHDSLRGDGHAILARCCLQYLSLHETQELAARIREHSHFDKPSQVSTKDELPLLRYAVEFCFEHCREAEKCGTPQVELIDTVFGVDDGIFQNYIALYNALHEGEKYSLGYNLLHLAVENNLAKYVDFRLSRNAADINVQLEGGQSYVQVAVWKTHHETLQVLLRHGADVNLSQTPASREKASYRVSYKHLHPLVMACQNGSLEMVKTLLENGANASDCTVRYRSMLINEALVSAAYSGKVDIVQLILHSDPVAFSHPMIRLGTMVGLYDAMNELLFEESRNPHRQSYETQLKSRLQVMQQIALLIFRGIDLYHLDFESISASMVWLMTGCHPDVLQQLIDLGTDFSGVERDGLSFLHVACLQGTVTSVQLLLQHRANPQHTYGPDEVSCLQLSLWNDTPAVLSYLLEIGTPVNTTDRLGTTALHEAAARRPAEFLEVLLRYDADRSLLDATGRRPFHHAIYNRLLRDHIGTLERLVYRPADIHLPDIYGLTPIHMSANCGSTAVVKWLVQEGVQVTAQDKYGRTALHLAAEASSPDSADVLTYLLHDVQGLDVNARDTADMTALHHIFYTYDRLKNHREFDPIVTTTNAKLLVEAGARLDAQDNAGNTPLHLAAWRGVKGLVSFFLSHGADPHVKDINKLRPLDLAAMEDVRELLEDSMRGRVDS